MKINDKVRTVEGAQRTDWHEDFLVNRRFNVDGVLVNITMNGLRTAYCVRHEDGTVAYYDQNEIFPLESYSLPMTYQRRNFLLEVEGLDPAFKAFLNHIYPSSFRVVRKSDIKIVTPGPPWAQGEPRTVYES